MGNKNVTRDIRRHSYGLGSNNQTRGLQKRNPQRKEESLFYHINTLGPHGLQKRNP